ncbi:sulfite exporter TauE/SafE family protein [Ideonella sp. B7]|uniref:sulfite exporter TauE/SafE family protein n=1 Tax=Ideonella benzenivorans TaxID=2831643 RepID=UPI001CED60A5|nr:sulfite exporter TauE/SafE family protein [Ideonella benzenivorans]MCA6215531.1 sulfite exporter TauE/SafE family protein [Ideonella benzenivorans]
MSDTWFLLLSAALCAGALNALAGGGSFLTLPALFQVGLPPIAANATSTVAVSPGYLGSTLGFRAELARLPASLLWRDSGICALGGLAGAGLLLVTPARLFVAVVPWLLLFATAVFAAGPWLIRQLHRPSAARAPATAPRWQRALGLAAVSVYGGYFNGGLGILLLALYQATGVQDLREANALKNLNSLVLSAVSVLTFAWAGQVHWPQALGMALAAIAGGYLGAALTRRLPPVWVRAVVIATGLGMTLKFLLHHGA